jgi:ribonuclease HII
MLKKHFGNDNNEIQVGVDEAGRGSLAGPVFAAAVIWDQNFEHENLKYIKDSKKLTREKRNMMREFIEKNALVYAVDYCDNLVIDEHNILNATYMAMHKALNKVYDIIKFKRILVDGNRFKPFICSDGFVLHQCVIKGDNEYLNIAAASILAKTYHDEYIDNLCDTNAQFVKYGWRTNMCYGTKEHINAIKELGLTEYHRKSYNINFK